MKKLAVLKLAIVLAVSVSLLAACASVNLKDLEPSSKYTHVVIGKVLYNISGYDLFAGTNINGIHTSNIDILFRNESGADFLVTGYDDGFMFSTGMPVGTWHLQAVYYKVMSSNASNKLTWTIESKKTFTVAEGRVTNLGGLYLIVDKKNGAYQIISGLDYDKPADLLSARVPDSKWLGMDTDKVKLY
jgi:hypothetical protein